MQPVKIKENIYWVGAIDWDLRDFHGYTTQRGSTYNSYLVLDEKVTLIDTVKQHLSDELLERISSLIDPSKIDYIVSNHVEMDHSGALPEIMRLAPKAVIITSPNGEKGLKAHFRNNWNYRVIKSGETIGTGKKSIDFFLTPMVHWPDNMVCYIKEDKMLFSNDAFGQHLASPERFDEQYAVDIIMEEAAKYYANIVLPYSSQVKNVLESVGGLDIEVIAPSHGIVWRSKTNDIIRNYKRWSANETDNKAVIIYDTMWKSTQKIAEALKSVFEDNGVLVRMLNLKVNHMSDIMTELLNAKYICVGSPTLNNNMLPSVAAFLTYMKGLAPKNRIGLAFGSYGWGGQSIIQVEEVLKSCGFEMMENIKRQYIPDKDILNEAKDKLSKR